MTSNLRNTTFLKRATLGISAAALSLGGLFLSGVNANAEAPQPVSGDRSNGTVVSSSLGALGALPNCASYGSSGQTAKVYNGCGYTIHAKILWAFAPDTACYALGPGGMLTSTRPLPARFDGAVSC